MSIPTCKLCKSLGLPGAKFCGACGTPYGDGGGAPEPATGALFESLSRSSSEADLDDLFSALPAPPEEPSGPTFGSGAAQGPATQLFMDAVGDTGAEDLFSSSLPGSGTGEKVDELGDFFSPRADGGIDDLFGGQAALDPDALFEATGTTGMQAAIPAGGDLGALFSSVPSSSTKTVAAATPDLFENDDLGMEAGPAMPSSDDLFAVPKTPSLTESTDDLFAFDPEDATVDVSLSSQGLPTISSTPGYSPGVGDLFLEDEASSDQFFNQTVPDLHDAGMEGLINLAAGEVDEDTMRQLVDDQQDSNSPVVPGLETGDLLAEAHLVADVGGQSFEPQSAATPGPGPHEDAVPPRPRERRAQRAKVTFTTLPPDPGWTGKMAALGGLLASSAALSVALHHDPRAASFSIPLLSAIIAIFSGLIFVVTFLVFRRKLAPEFLSRGLAVMALAFAYSQIPPTSLAVGEPSLGMLLCLLLGIGSVLWSHLLFLSLRISLGIVGVYASLSLITGVVEGVPYLELVTRRVLQAPGLAAHLAPDRLALLLKGFDPLFLAVNFFLPVVLLLGLLEALYDAKKRWWGEFWVRVLQTLLTGATLYLNLQLYQQNQVPNLLSLAGLK